LTTSTDRTHVSFDELSADLYGQIIMPGDADYAVATWTYTGGIEPHPQVVLRPGNAEQVANVIALAKDTGLEFSVRSGGHSSVGHGVCDGIVLDLGGLKKIDIDVESRTAWVETGASAGEYTNAAWEHGLVTPFGDTGSVGLGGITLGGGIGYLVRKLGATVDSLLAAEIVTADGRILQLDDETNADLFWAVKGGGGNFGVVTKLKFKLYEQTPIHGGMMCLPATPETISGFIAAAQSATEDLSTIANVMTAPPMPFLPEDVHGTPVILAMICYSGPLDAAEETLAPLRALGTYVDFVQEIPYPGMYPPEDPSERPVAAACSMFLDKVDADDAQKIIDHLTASDAAMSVIQLRVLGGALSRVPNEATAFAHRQSKIMANLAAVYADPSGADRHWAWLWNFHAAMLQSDHGVYVGFLVDEGETRIRAAYPHGAYERLAAVKAEYDPENFFTSNQNIPPAS
jgi:FAD/FMN-containing dehydrogenase